MAIAVACLSGCGAPVVYVKPSVTYEGMNDDKDYCRKTTTARGWYQVPQGGGLISALIMGTAIGLDLGYKKLDLEKECMADQGYRVHELSEAQTKNLSKLKTDREKTDFLRQFNSPSYLALNSGPETGGSDAAMQIFAPPQISEKAQIENRWRSTIAWLRRECAEFIDANKCAGAVAAAEHRRDGELAELAASQAAEAETKKAARAEAEKTTGSSPDLVQKNDAGATPEAPSPPEEKSAGPNVKTSAPPAHLMAAAQRSVALWERTVRLVRQDCPLIRQAEECERAVDRAIYRRDIAAARLAQLSAGPAEPAEPPPATSKQ